MNKYDKNTVKLRRKINESWSMGVARFGRVDYSFPNTFEPMENLFEMNFIAYYTRALLKRSDRTFLGSNVEYVQGLNTICNSLCLSNLQNINYLSLIHCHTD